MYKIYSLSDCENCDLLKQVFLAYGIEFTESSFDTEVQSELIMQNVFDDPPILEKNGKIVDHSIVETIIDFGKSEKYSEIKKELVLEMLESG